MSTVLMVHGMNMGAYPRETLEVLWYRELRKLLGRTEWARGRGRRGSIPARRDVTLVYWADLFRTPVLAEQVAFEGGARASGIQNVPSAATRSALLDRIEAELRRHFYHRPGAARPAGGAAPGRRLRHAVLRGSVLAADRIVRHTADGRPRGSLATLLDPLVAETAVYMQNGPVYRPDPVAGDGAFFQVQARFRAALTPATRIVIGHSIGSVVAYEALCRLPHSVDTFVTVGSPMATPAFVLEPLKRRLAAHGLWVEGTPLPAPRVRRWWNFCADADVWCAPVPRLGPLFGGVVRDVALDHGTSLAATRTHELSAYLQHLEIGNVLADALEASRPLEAPPGRISAVAG